MFPKVPASGSKQMPCSQQRPCLFDVVADYREEHDLADDKPDVVARMQSRLAVLMEGVFEADRVRNVTQDSVCAASVANGMWITPADWPLLPPTPAPAPECRPPSPGTHPPSHITLPADKWLAYMPQWEVNGSSIKALKTCAVLKKACTQSRSLPANETQFFDKDVIVRLSAHPKPTTMCSNATSQYYEVSVHLPAPEKENSKAGASEA